MLLGLACGGGEGNQTPVTPGTPRVSPKELRGLEVTLSRNDLRVGQVAGPALAYARYDDGTTGVVDGEGCVECAIRCINQNGQTSALGTATVVLPGKSA